MDCWMGERLDLALPSAGLAWWVAARLAIHPFSDFVLHGFPYAFWHGFGIDFGTIFEDLSIIWNRYFCFRIFHRILSNFHGISGPSNHGKFNYYVGLFEKTEELHFRIFHQFCIRFYIHFGIILEAFLHVF